MHHDSAARKQSGDDHSASRPRRSEITRGARLVIILRMLLWPLGVTASVSICFLGYLHVKNGSDFRLKRIDISGNVRSSTADLLDVLSPFKGKSIFDLDSSDLASRLKRFSWIKYAKILIRLPDAIRVDVSEYRPVAAVWSRGFYLVDEFGEIFRRAQPRELLNLPIVTGIDEAQLLSSLNSHGGKLEIALSALKTYRSSKRPPLSEIHVGKKNTVTLFLLNGATAIYFGSEYSAERLDALDSIWASLGRDARRAQAIYMDHDCRPERIVVRMARREI